MVADFYREICYLEGVKDSLSCIDFAINGVCNYVKLGISQRLFGAILLASCLAVVALLAIMQWNLNRGFLKFVREAEQTGIERLSEMLQDYYSQEQSWRRLQGNTQSWNRLVFNALADNFPFGPPAGNGPSGKPQPMAGPQIGNVPPDDIAPRDKKLPPHIAQDTTSRLFLFDGEGRLLVGDSGLSAEVTRIALTVNGQLVGYLGFIPVREITDNRHLMFLEQQVLTFTLVAGVVVVLATLLSILLARRLVRPIKKLAAATHCLAKGDFAARVQIHGQDELAQLANDFNLLAITLGKNEDARKQWVADISHELRTPIGVLRGEIEALIDGIRQSDSAALHSLQAETLRLGRLVDDLYQLSMSDLGALNYRKEIVDLSSLLEDVLSAYEHEFEQHGMILDYHSCPDILILGDVIRLHQLFGNILDNTLKYTDRYGKLRVHIAADRHHVTIDFEDSLPGVGQDDLERIFERLYRVESSRNRQTGGSGLGLSICRNIVEAHQGTIVARTSPLGGLWLQIRFPLAGVKNAGNHTDC